MLQTQIKMFCSKECDLKHSDYVPAPYLFTPSPLSFIRESLLLGIYSYASSVLGCLLCTKQTHISVVASFNNTSHYTRWHYKSQVQHYLYKQPSPESIKSSVHNLCLIHQDTYWYWYNPMCIFQEFLPPPSHWPLQHDLWRNNTHSYHASLLWINAHYLFILKDREMTFSFVTILLLVMKVKYPTVITCISLITEKYSNHDNSYDSVKLMNDAIFKIPETNSYTLPLTLTNLYMTFPNIYIYIHIYIYIYIYIA
jgi:hypothetical protein